MNPPRPTPRFLTPAPHYIPHRFVGIRSMGMGNRYRAGGWFLSISNRNSYGLQCLLYRLAHGSCYGVCYLLQSLGYFMLYGIGYLGLGIGYRICYPP